MVASTSIQPQDVPLPPSPTNTSSKPGKFSSSNKGKGKGKGKEIAVRCSGKSPTSPGSKDDSGLDEMWDWVSLSDSHVSKLPPVFTRDGSYFFSLAGSSVKIFSSSTGQLVSTLYTPRNGKQSSSDCLTSLILNPHNVFQIITGSSDGFLRVWDYLDATLLKSIDVGQPILRLCAHEKHNDYVFASVTRRKEDRNCSDNNAVVLRISLKATETTVSSAVQRPSEILLIGKTRFPTGLALSPSGNWLVATAGHKSYVATLSSIKSGFTKYVSPERLSCLAFHPSEDYFATGDVKGNIRLWYCLNDSAGMKVAGVEKKTHTTSFHWHAHAVSSLAFTSNGAYLLSGGEESVLVVWQLQTGRKEFVPRVGAPIQTISVTKAADGVEEYLLGLVDATYAFVSAASLKVSRSYARIKLGPVSSQKVLSSSKPVPLAVHSLSSTLILPSSHPSSVQIYSPSSSKILSELEVSPSNRVSRRDEKPLEPSRVERTVISHSSEWMASIDSRAGDEDVHGEVYLKIWRWDKKTSLWTLNTRIDRPHGTHEVTDLSFSPLLQASKDLFLVSAGGDGTVKTWRIRTSFSKGGNKEEFWAIRSSFGFRSEKPSHISWSPDGSLLALTLGPCVAIYDPLTNARLGTLTSPECKSAKAAFFVARGRSLAVIGTRDLVLWDVVSQSVRWSYKSSTKIETLVPHPEDNTFALFTSASGNVSKINVFATSLPTPVRNLSLPLSLRAVAWYFPKHISPDPLKSYSLVGISRDWRIIVCGDNVSSGVGMPEEEGTATRGLKSFAPSQRRTLFQDIFGKSIFDPVESSSTYEPKVGVSEGSISSIFDKPTHLMPPIETLYDGLMKRYLKRRPEDVSLFASQQKDEGEDVEMEDEPMNSAPTSLRTPTSLRDSESDMPSLIELFKTHSLQPDTRTGSRHRASNGSTKTLANKASNSPLNSASYFRAGTPVISVSATKTPKSRPPPETTEAMSPSPTIVNGKKRKKVSD
ncbi:WD40 repeat-like protein [Dendrothele bispora CBS 962.96]|uniref:WD40 repeat-like protein n=1 Tax=Dendrothele bispora (strain CBS 962.96) TaxID=1314807 RepID=A0A4S8MW34_DENBC|nr:WD40 repeat-like protein [Dendrothele bispora CBS 962.96]